MSKYTTIKCWNLSDAVTDPQIITQSKPSLMLIKKAILKVGFRAFAVDDRAEIEKQAWYPRFLLGEEVRFYIDGSGVYRLVNCDLTESELYFERLNVPLGFKPWIFYSWQSDYNPARSSIQEALTEAKDYINKELSPRLPLEIIAPTSREDGAKNIVDAIKENISKCMFAIFDITNVAPVWVTESPDKKTEATANNPKVKGKTYPNANVVFELSYALALKTPDQILLLKRSRKDDFDDDRVPFDFEHNRHIEFDKPTKIKADLKAILIEYFRKINYIKGQ